jgi:tetratricopeptide (TPR) repeat protein
MNLGNLYGQRRDYKQAIQHYLKVLEISPHNPTNKKYEISK